MSDIPLRALLDDAHEHHPHEPRRIADALRARAPALPDDAEGAEAVRLAEHVLLAHLSDVQGLREWLERVPARHAALQPAVERARWAIAACKARDGATAPPSPALSDATRWRALQNVLLACAQQGDATRATAWLRAEEGQAAASAVPDERIAYAACANNVAMETRMLLEASSGVDQARAALMLAAAAIARRAWERAGTWLHVERAEYQLALCHAALGHGPQALQHAHRCLAICEVSGADALERFFAHEAMARAHRAQMQSLLGGVGDASMQAWCRQALQALGG